MPAKLDELAEKHLRAQRRLEHPAAEKTIKVSGMTIVDVGQKFAHTSKDVKKDDPTYRGPLWKPEFSI